jgi:UDP-glucose 4-epimerase
LHLLGSGNQVRHYTYGGDLAKGIAACVFHPRAANESFNLSTSVGTTVLELAELIWRKVHGTGPEAKPFRYVSDGPYPYDVQRRVPDVSKARREIGFAATTGLGEVLDEVIPWIRRELAAGRI